MRRMWLALAVTSAISIGACAAGSSGTASPIPGAVTTDDSGAPNQENNPGEDSGGPVVNDPPPSDDSGQPSSGDDSATGPGEDDSAAPSEDSGTVTSEDSGGTPYCAAGGSSTETGLTYTEEWTLLHNAGEGISCSSGPSACPSANCCYLPAAGASEALCVDL